MAKVVKGLLAPVATLSVIPLSSLSISLTTAGLSLAAVLFTPGDANAAQWCAYVDQSVVCEWNSFQQCVASNKTPPCFRDPSE
jgi:hypothetical protein